MGKDFRKNKFPLKTIAIFASGSGSNAKAIIEDLLPKEGFEKECAHRVGLVVCNKPEAGVLKIAAAYQIPVLMLERSRFFEEDGYLNVLRMHQIDLVVLAGFLWKVPEMLIEAFPKKIINIHPSLLPKFGGKGMYGLHVHTAVIAANEPESGITIHFVDNQYDHGEILFQAKVNLTSEETPISLAEKIQQLEHLHFPRIVRELLNGN